jgi:hypothetical protein
MTVAQLEPLVTLDDLSQYIGMSTRWLEYRRAEGMPSAEVGTSRRYRISRCEDWLRKEGHLKEDGE